MPDVPFPGFHYDQGRAEAMADAMRTVLAQARLLDVERVDQVAAVGILAAELIMASKLRTAPEYAVQQLAAFTLAWASRISATGKPTP